MGTPMGTTNLQDLDMDSVGLRSLLRSAMTGKWDHVVSAYTDNPKVYAVQSNLTGDTALHLAVRDGQEDTVEELVNLMCRNEEKAKAALKVANEEGNTALHIAAEQGNVRMCSCIAKAEPSLVGARNGDGETPLFSAANYGKKDAFLLLLSICGLDGGLSYCRRSDGDTILHVAIAGEYLDLAFQIISTYKELANTVNQKGMTPLHILASKPDSFRSGSHLGCYHKLLYYCIFVDELKIDDEMFKQPVVTKASSSDDKPTYPQNYETCMNFLRLPKWVYKIFERTRPQQGDPENQQNKSGNKSTQRDRRGRFIPSNYDTCFEIIKFMSKAMLIILGLGSSELKNLHKKKEKHTWSLQILDQLLQQVMRYDYAFTGKDPSLSHETSSPFVEGGEYEYPGKFFSPDQSSGDHEVPGKTREGGKTQSTLETPQVLFPEKEGVSEMVEKSVKSKNLDANEKPKTSGMAEKETVILLAAKSGITEVAEKILEIFPAKEKPKTSEMEVKETAILIAAKNGITEIVEKILEIFPAAIHDVNPDRKNIVLLAVENRQPQVYELLMKRKVMRDNIFRKVDKEGNSALHLAATTGENTPWRIPGSALQMQWEIKWYEFVKKSMPSHFFPRYNKANETPKEIFNRTHKDLLKGGGEWLTHTSESCSVVAALIATVAFATSATVPGGVNQEKGTPTLEKHPAFDTFAISSLVALCFSVTAVVMFLAILTSRFQEKDFRIDLPRKLLLGLSSLFVSIAAILVSFCAGHFFVLRDQLQYAALPVYAVTCFPVTLFAIAQFPLYFDLVRAIFKKVPQRSYMVVH